MSTVWKVVDDTDPRLEYSEGWIAGSNSFDDFGLKQDINEFSRDGDVYNNTLHWTSKNGTSLTFRFNGTSLLGVYGTWSTSIPFIDSEDNSELPEAGCYLDGVRLLTFSTNFPMGTASNNQILCRGDPRFFNGTMFSGEHELLVNSTVHSPFMIDYIVYETVPDAPVDGDILQMGNNVIQFTEGQDPHLSFSPGWASNSNNAVWTSTPGSYATLKFNGTGVQLYGELAGDSSNVATYRVDDQEPKSFELFPHSSVNVTHQMLFNLSSLTPGEHELVVMHNGTPSGMPLAIDWFLVASLTTEEQASLSSSPLPSPPSVPSSHTPSGAIVGGVIGALAILGLLSLLIFVCLKRRRRRLQEERERAHPFTEMPSPTLTKLVTSDFDPYNLDPPHPSLPQRSYKPEFEPLRREESDSLSPVGLLSGQSSEGLRNMKQQQSLTVTQSQSSEQRNSHWNTDETMSPSVLSASALQHSQDSSVVIHTDSGLRMTEPGVFSDRRRVVEVPPNYTAT